MEGLTRQLLRRILFLAIVLGSSPAMRAAEPPPPPAATSESSLAASLGDSAPVVVWGRTLVSYRLALEFPDVAERARAAGERISQALGRIDATKLAVQKVQIGAARGFVVSAGPLFLLSVMDGDLDPAAGVTPEVVANDVMVKLRELVRDHADQHTITLVIRSVVQSAIATVLFAGFCTAALWLRSRLLVRVTRTTREAGHALRVFGYDWRPVLLGIVTTLTRLLMLAVILCGTYIWVTYVLGRFPYTQHWADQLGQYLFAAVGTLASGAVHQIPNLIALVVIYLVTRGLIRALNGWFTAIESGHYFTSWLDPEAARATRRLADIGVWIVALIIAFPYLPGSHSEAFKGVSVFLGLMLSLGGAGFVGQIIGGLAAVYSRAVRSGDYIIVGETQGVVKELGLLTTKVITRTREEVTIPNSMLISSAIRNFSRAGGNMTVVSTAVTIGYDAPWRQVEAMLLRAAALTDGLLNDPPPRVLQSALDDFYVHYELTGCVSSAAVRGEVLARLHGHIQDVFNEHGVQIMSPHFENQPAAAVVVPRDRWHVKLQDTGKTGPT